MNSPRVVIVGASSGLGKEIAHQYLDKHCAKVVVAARREDLLNKISTSDRLKSIKTDVRDPKQCKALIDASIEWLGAIDVLILNAGVGMDACFDTIDDLSLFDDILSTNFWGVAYCLQYVYQHADCHNTKVVITSDALVFSCVERVSFYVASKYALEGLVDSVRKEGATFPISIVYPSAVCTDFYKKLLLCDGSTTDGDYPHKFVQNSHLMDVCDAAQIYICSIQQDVPKCRIFLDEFNRIANYFRPFSARIANFLSHISLGSHFHYCKLVKYVAPLAYLTAFKHAKHYKTMLEKEKVGSKKHSELLQKCCKEVGSIIDLKEKHGGILDRLSESDANQVIQAYIHTSSPSITSTGSPNYEDTCEGPNVLIIGGSIGLGKSIAAEYGRIKAKLVLSSRSKEFLKISAEDARKSGAQAVSIIPCNVESEEDIKFLLSNTVNQFEHGIINRVVYNVGECMQACFRNIDDMSVFDSILDINYYGLVRTMSYLIPILRAQYEKCGVRAKVTITVCVAGKTGIPEWSLFSAAKFAVTAFARTIAKENKDAFDIVLVYPPIMQTKLQTRLLLADGTMSGATGSFVFDQSYFKTSPYYMPPDVAAQRYVKGVEHGCGKDVFLDRYNQLADVLRPWSSCLADFLSYLSWRMPTKDILEVPERFHYALSEICKLEKSIKECGARDPCDGYSPLPQIRLLEHTISE